MPQVADIMRANARDVVFGLDEVNEEVLPFFQETSEQILQKYDPVQALGRALALITGYTNSIQ